MTERFQVLISPYSSKESSARCKDCGKTESSILADIGQLANCCTIERFFSDASVERIPPRNARSLSLFVLRSPGHPCNRAVGFIFTGSVSACIPYPHYEARACQDFVLQQWWNTANGRIVCLLAPP